MRIAADIDTTKINHTPFISGLQAGFSGV